jgi:sulfonate dioxygenase
MSPTVDAKEELVSYDINIPYTAVSAEEKAKLESSTNFPDYLPTWDQVWYDPLPIFPFKDPALRADPSKPHLGLGQLKVSEITPRMGTIIEGMDLATLTDIAKDELALLVAERKILVFPQQDAFLDLVPGAQEKWMAHFGKLNYQPVSGSLKGHPGFHIIHRDGNKEEFQKFFTQKTTSTLWHQDVSYEHQPPGYVMLTLLQGPEVGGDTVFAATDEAYK